jgi:hypothetical protein
MADWLVGTYVLVMLLLITFSWVLIRCSDFWSPQVRV